MPWLPKKGMFEDWPKDAQELHLHEVIELYKNGFAGAKQDLNALDRLHATMEWPDADAAAHHFGIADTGAGKLVIPYVFVMEMFPGCWPGKQGQGRGSCVAWNTRNAGLLTMCCDIASGQPDEKTGKPEQKPEVPQEGIADGVLSTEAIYWYRGYDGDGWSCPDAAMVACKEGGLVVRKNYSELGFDLTTYSARTEGKWGRQSPPSNVQAITSQHLVHQATDASSLEATRDLLFNGYGVSTCGDEGFSDSRDENGVSSRSGSWAHAMSFIAVDDRPIIKERYREPLVLVLNSWAKWNSGGRDILQSESLVPPLKKDLWTRLGIVNSSTGRIMIPEGSFWTPWSNVRNREIIGFSGVNGWPRKDLESALFKVFGN